MEPIVSEIVGRIVNTLTGYITKQLRYVTSSKKHVTDMRNRMKVLEDTSVDVKEHKHRNNMNYKEVPARVSGWLDEVETLKNEVESIPSNAIGCLHMKTRYQAGRNASKATERIERLIAEKITWTDAPIPTGRPTSSLTSTPSSSPSDGDGFRSREKPFNNALQFLQQDDIRSQVIALHGMGGVGKTTMMKELKIVANDKKMFGLFVEVVIGRSPNMLSIQNQIAECIGGEGLHVTGETARGERLCEMFKKTLEEEGKKKILVILDDVWQTINLELIGLTSPLPNGVKVLLTSREASICGQIAANAHAGLQIVRVDVLEETEANNFFSRFTEVSEEVDHDKYLIGREIVKKCGCLPLAIRLIGSTLKFQEVHVWRDQLNRLKHNDLDKNVQEIIMISYEKIEDEDKEVLLLCGLFPEDFNIPIEHLVRYAWGLNLLQHVSTLTSARDKTRASVSKLINASLLTKSDYLGCVKLHDLVLAFVLDRVSKSDPAWIINHTNVSKWDIDQMSYACKIISLTCMGVVMFPEKFKYPDLSLLQLMHGDEFLKFPEDFYENMQNLKVMAYYKMEYPLLPRSLKCSVNLRTLCLHECKLMFDLSFVGDLMNLEELSFAGCGIRKLPSTMRYLKKLRLLDLTGCVNLVIDDGVFGNLKNLEELYMRTADDKGIRFTDVSFEEFKTLVVQLCALEFEFVEIKSQLKNWSFKTLDKFKISMGCRLKEVENRKYSFINTLKIVTDNFKDLLDYKVDELLKKTEKLHLHVKDMISLRDVSVHLYDQQLFCCLRDLKVSNCANLKYLFTVPVANGLRKLECLTISSCSVLQEVVHNDGSEINTVGEMITFDELKFLCLKKLPKLVSLFPSDSVVKLPQLVELELEVLPNVTSIYLSPYCSNISALQHPFLNSQVRVPKLEKLKIESLEMLKQLWAHSSEEAVTSVSVLREMIVKGCDSLENLFPTNPVQLLSHLESLSVVECGSVEVIVNIDLGRVGELIKFEELKLLSLTELPKLVRLFHCDCVVELLQLVELKLEGLPNFTSIYPDSSNVSALQQPFLNSRVRIPKLEKLWIRSMVKLKQIWPCSSAASVNIVSMLREIEVRKCDTLENLFPTNPMLLLSHLENLSVEGCDSIEEIFNLDLGCVGVAEQPSKSCLRSIQVRFSANVREVWRIKGGENNSCESMLLIHGFEAVEKIWVQHCKMFRNVFTRTNTKLDMRAPLYIDIDHVGVDEKEVIDSSWRDDEIYFAAFPSNLMQSFHYLKDISLYSHNGVEAVFQIESLSSNSELVTTTNNRLLPNLQSLTLCNMKKMSHLWKCNDWNKFFGLQKQSSFQNLTTITVMECHRVRYLFSPLMGKLLSNLREIVIKSCDDMEEVVSNRDDADGDNEITAHATTTFFPSLHKLYFGHLKNLKCFGGVGEDKVSKDGIACWSLCQYSTEIHIENSDKLSSVIPSYAVGQMQKLEVLTVKSCDSLMEVFETQGIKDMNNGGDGGTSHSGLRRDNISVPQLSNLTKLEIASCNLLQHVFTFSTLESLEQLQELVIKKCMTMKVVVKNEKNEDQRKVVKFPHLKSLELDSLPSLEGFFLGLNEFEWPLLEKVTIRECPQMRVFTCGESRANELKYIYTSLGKHALGCGLNFHGTTGLPHQDPLPSSESTSLCLERLPRWSFHNLVEIDMEGNLEIGNIIPSDELRQLQKLERIRAYNCWHVKEVFEVAGMELEGGNNESQTVVEIPNLRHVEFVNLLSHEYIWKSNHHHNVVLEFPNLTTLSISVSPYLKHVFTTSMVSSLAQLQELNISVCKEMEVIIANTEDEDVEIKCGQPQMVVLPCLKVLKLNTLDQLRGFCLGKVDFSCPSLDTLEILACPQLTLFTKGNLDTPKLDIIHTVFGRCYVGEEDINSFIKNKKTRGISILKDEEEMLSQI